MSGNFRNVCSLSLKTLLHEDRLDNGQLHHLSLTCIISLHMLLALPVSSIDHEVIRNGDHFSESPISISQHQHHGGSAA